MVKDLMKVHLTRKCYFCGTYHFNVITEVTTDNIILSLSDIRQSSTRLYHEQQGH